MQAVVFTQLSPSELGQLIYEQVERCLAQQSIKPKAERIGGIELAQEITGLTQSTIYSLTYRRKIPFSKQGKKLYFHESDLLKWLEDGKRKTRKEIAVEAAAYGAN